MFMGHSSCYISSTDNKYMVGVSFTLIIGLHLPLGQCYVTIAYLDLDCHTDSNIQLTGDQSFDAWSKLDCELVENFSTEQIPI